MSTRSKRLTGERTVALVRNFLGTTDPKIIVSALLLLVSFGLFVNGLTNQLVKLQVFRLPTGWVGNTISLAVFPLLFIVLFVRARQVRGDVRINVVPEDAPHRVHGLILFLSPLGRDTDVLEKVIRVNHHLSDERFRAMFTAAWRMPLEAIAYHMERLERVIVIPSADSTTADGRLVSGTVTEVSLFVELVQNVLQKPDVKILTIADAIAQLPDGQSTKMDFSKGVRFEDMTELVEAVEMAYRSCRAAGYSNFEALVDITGGLKLPSAAGAIMATGDARRFQYVSTMDYRVRTFDVTYLDT